jgi:hypothetical protein
MQFSVTLAWAKAYIVFPLVPCLLDAIIRYVVKQPTPMWKTISASNLALSIGILALFVMQTIVARNIPLEDEESKQYRLGFGYEFGFYSIVAFAFFGVLSFIDMIPDKYQELVSGMSLGILYFLVSLSTAIIVLRSLQAQRTFKLVIS